MSAFERAPNSGECQLKHMTCVIFAAALAIDRLGSAGLVGNSAQPTYMDVGSAGLVRNSAQPTYSHPLLRAMRAASMRLLAPSLSIASDR